MPGPKNSLEYRSNDSIKNLKLVLGAREEELWRKKSKEYLKT
jgi:hypothetical protein